MKWLAILVVVLAAAPVADAAKRPRPDAVPAPAAEQLAPNAIQVFNDYVAPARTYASRRAVVHFVVLGVSAPPLNDDDVDGVPDYVERVGDAADTAIAYYERRGFAAILADAGGPDARPDLYVSRFAAGYFGVAFPSVDAESGAFLAVSNALDPSPSQSLGSLYGTVAHELFHLVQFSYFEPTDELSLNGWVLEGAAAAMETRVYPELEDIVARLQLRTWFANSGRSVTEQSYGAQLLWRFLDERQPGLLPAYLAAVARRPNADAALLLSTYQRVARRPFAPAFDAFAAWAAERYGDRLEHLPQLAPSGTRAGSVSRLRIQYVRLSRAVRSVTVRFERAPARATLTYALASMTAGEPATMHRVRGRATARGVTFAVPPALRAGGRFERATLVIANGAGDAISYRASAA